MKSAVKGFILIVSVLMIVGLQFIPAQAVDNTGEEAISGICISLKVDSNEVLLNGESRTLNNAPFFENNIAYVPLREIVELCGGIVKYIPSERSVMIALKKKGDNEHTYFSQIWVGKNRVLNDGYRESKVSSWMYPSNNYENYIPVTKNGRVFVPANYFNRFEFAGVHWNPENGRIIISNLDEGLGVGEFQLGENFSLLNDDIKNRFKSTGRINNEFESHQEEVFSDGNIEITLWTQTDSQKTDLKDYKEIVRIVLISDMYSTPRGLRVGDSVDRFLALYDNDSLMNHFLVETDDGKVTKIIIRATG